MHEMWRDVLVVPTLIEHAGDTLYPLLDLLRFIP